MARGMWHEQACAQASCCSAYRGQTERVFSHREMQSRWKTWPQQPQAIEYPASSASPGSAHVRSDALSDNNAAVAVLFYDEFGQCSLAWASMDGSYNLLRQIAQVSAGQSEIGSSVNAIISHAADIRRARADIAHLCKCPMTRK